MKIISKWPATRVLRWPAGCLILALTVFAVMTWSKGHHLVIVERVILLADYVSNLVELAAIVLIVIGVLEAIYTMFIATIRTMASSGFMPSRKYPTLFKREEVSGSLTHWLLLGLLFAIAADIIRTSVSPTWNEIGRLAAIIGIRAFLNFMLEREIGKASGSEQKDGQPGAEVAAASIKRSA